MSLLKGLINQEIRLAEEIKEANTHFEERAGRGVFLVLQGEANIATPDFNLRRDWDDFAICIDAIEPCEVNRIFRSSVQGVLAAVALALPADADRSVEKIGAVLYFVDSTSGKPIYPRTFSIGSARVSLARQLTRKSIDEMATLAAKIDVADTGVAGSVELLLTSLEKATDQLQAFITSWSALEIFVNVTFASRYKNHWLHIMKTGAPTSATPVFKRIEEIMRDKYRLADKFLIIASLLSPEGAVDDEKEFRRLKDFRDKFLHKGTTSLPFPTADMQELLLKYLKLHLCVAEPS